MCFLASSTSADVSPWMILPFAALLLSIALGPLLAPKFWHHHYPKVAIGLGAVTASYYFFVLHAAERLVHVGQEYISFVVLIGSLFVAAGGIHIVVKGESRPSTNVVFLFLGAVIANVIGTTGASMLLIRPWIRMNKYRITAFHIVFFIFIVSNVGGVLTPIGDPPLFLGYLRGVPFWWVFEQCWPMWILGLGLLLILFYVLDRLNFRRPPREVTEAVTASEEWKFQGLHNLLFIAVILLAVLYNKHLPLFVAELVMVGAAIASFHTTPKSIHEANDFNFAPIKEVAWLFAGIFAAMVPALDYLGAHASDLGIKTPHQFYWATGSLSAFLDNAPTYLTFLSAQMGLHHLNVNSTADVLSATAKFPLEIVAISVGAVFFGAMSYIGNGPNLMVKAIAEQAKVRTPSFFGYIFRYSIPFLLPVLVIVGLLFFSKWRVF
jgi:Na+/H+ antiporter NhaD/arsenite permease-like protein